MSDLWALVDAAVVDALTAHPDYLTPKGQEAARKLIVRKVTGALRDSMSAPKPKTDEADATATTPSAAPQEPAISAVDCWSKEWWALLVHKIVYQQPTAWMLQYARNAKQGAPFVVRPGEMPNTDTIASFRSYPSNGEVMAEWRPWFDRHGVRLPEWRERMWVFLPGTFPPDKDMEGFT